MKFSSSFGVHYLEGDNGRVQVEFLTPINFSRFPTSNTHNKWVQVAGYRVILRYQNLDPKPFIEHMKEFMEQHASDPRYKRYKIR